VPGRLPDIVAALDGLLDPLKYPWACSRLAISAGLITPYRCCLTARTSCPARGELGLEGGLLTFSGIAVAGLKLSNCLEYLLFAGGVGMARVPTEGRGDPEEEGV
jgi:hypothetical protein